jgi:exodeoxyribonuclease-3
MKLTTWNINSVRLRIGLVERYVAEAQPDVLCLQEIKTVNDTFPDTAFAAMGYPHRLVHGMKGYNGVAIVSRVPFEVLETRAWYGLSDRRHAAVRLANGVELHNFYVPAGGDVPDPDENPKFAHKLAFLDEATAYFEDRVGDGVAKIIVGDLNIAPLETDVWSHKQLLDVVSHTPIEVEKLDLWRDRGGFVDGIRHVIPPTQTLFSWWSYRARDWDLADRGRRLDHVWVTPGLLPTIVEARIDRAARGWEQPSDHVPVTLELR